MERVRYFLASHKKLVFACAAGVALLLVLLITIKILFSARLYVMVAPENATVKINGKEYSNGEHKLMIGHKTVEISGEGFETEKTELNLGIFSNKTILRAYAVNGSYDYYKENANSYIILKHINSMDGNEETKAFVSKMEKAYKLKYDLPLSNNFDNSFGRTAFSTITDATDEEECKALLCLRLDKTTNKAKEAMKERLAALGYNVEDYVIFYGELPEDEDTE